MATRPTNHKYYVPEASVWPFVLTVAIFAAAGSAALWLNGDRHTAPVVFWVSTALVALSTFVWFRAVVNENLGGAYARQEDLTFRWSMAWFIYAELMLFSAFFFALIYSRLFAIPWLSGEGAKHFTGQYLWPHFNGAWPSNGPADVGGAFTPVSAWGGPLISTIIMLSSSATLTWAHWALKLDKRGQVWIGVAATLALGSAFLVFQVVEYLEAYQELGLTLGTGIYGATFFMLTGFDAVHVVIGLVMLAVILARLLMGHFDHREMFGFEGVAWYWHFVDAVWLVLFVSVYIL